MDACSSGELEAEVVLVISNNSKSGALRRAHEAGIKGLHISGVTHPEGESQAILDALVSAEADWVLTLGYMKKIGSEVLNHFENRVINSHPSLLPKFGGAGYYGRKIQESVIASGELESGATIHLVNQEYDRGAIIAQSKVLVESFFTASLLHQTVQKSEKLLLVNTLKRLLTQ